MKEINMTKAISCMPDKFITMEMVELAAAEHRPELYAGKENSLNLLSGRNL